MVTTDRTGLFARLGRHKVVFALGFVLTASIVAAVFTALPRTYRGSAALMVASNEEVLRGGDSSAEAQRLGDPADVESQMLMLRSPRLARMILTEPDVAKALFADCEASREATWLTRLTALALKPPACAKPGEDDQAELTHLAGGFSIGPTGRSRVIEVSFVSSLPATAVTVANALVNAYLRDDRARKVDTHEAAIKWLTAEVANSGQELKKSELEIEAYRTSHGIVRGQLASITSERLSSLAQQLAIAQASYAQVLSRLNQPSGDGNVQEVLNSRTVSDLKQQSAEIAGRYAELRQRYGENYPAVQAAANQRREIEGQLGQESRRVTVSLQRDVQAAAARVAALKQQYDGLMREVGDTGGAEAGIAIMVRDVEAHREIYMQQLKEVSKLQTEARLLAGDARLVNHAELPDRPWFPRRLPFVAVGTVLASAVGAGLALLRDSRDRTLRGTTAVAGISIVGYLPWVRKSRGSRWPVLHLHNASPLQESVRALFSRFVLVPGRPPKKLMIASSEVGEGKTFLALSLALFAVTTKRRVLVIEADLRRPSFRAALNLPEGPGLSEFLRGEANAAEVITRYHGLHVITAGKPSVDSTELLSKVQFDALLRASEIKYDLIVLDSPPTLSVMDAHVLARRVDGILYCASYGRSNLDRVMQGIRNIAAAGGRVLGIVVGGGPGNELPQYDVPGLLISSYLPVRS